MSEALVVLLIGLAGCQSDLFSGSGGERRKESGCYVPHDSTPSGDGIAHNYMYSAPVLGARSILCRSSVTCNLCKETTLDLPLMIA